MVDHFAVFHFDPHRVGRFTGDHHRIPACELHMGRETPADIGAGEPPYGVVTAADTYQFTASPCRGCRSTVQRRGGNDDDIFRIASVGDGLVLTVVPEECRTKSVSSTPLFILLCRYHFIIECRKVQM